MRLTNQEFTQKSRVVHGDKYDYSLVDYKNNRTKIKIICSIHDVFEQIPSNHLMGKGCNKCGYKKSSNKIRKTKEEIIHLFKKVHGDIYDYSLVEYESAIKKVKIICEFHNVFKQSPAKHLSGGGCPSCKILKIKKSLTKNEYSVINNFKKVHGNKYDYSLVNYVNAKTKVKIICKIHRVFEQEPTSHLNGNGCPDCASIIRKERSSKNPIGWTITNWNKSAKRSKNFDSFKVYIIRCWNNEEEFYKIGRTFKTVKKRFRSKKQMPYNYEIIKEMVFNNAKDAHNKETELKRLHKEYNYLPKIKFDGMNECFTELNN